MLELYFQDNQYPFDGITHCRKVARGIILNEKNQIVLNHVVTQDIFGLRDVYETPGGGVKEGETIEMAVLREIEEETGLQCEIMGKIGVVHDFYHLIHRENENHYYLLRVVNHKEKHLEAYEKEVIQEMVWFSFDEAIEVCQTKQFGGVGKLVQQRELPIILEAKRICDAKNIK